MLHKHVYSDPKAQVRIVIDGGNMQLFEGDTLIREMKTLKVKDIESYLEGFFAGAAYQADEIRSLKKAERGTEAFEVNT